MCILTEGTFVVVIPLDVHRDELRIVLYGTWDASRVHFLLKLPIVSTAFLTVEDLLEAFDGVGYLREVGIILLFIRHSTLTLIEYFKALTTVLNIGLKSALIPAFFIVHFILSLILKSDGGFSI